MDEIANAIVGAATLFARGDDPRSVRTAYAALSEALHQAFGGNSAVVAALHAVESDPTAATHQDRLASALAAVQADRYADLRDRARELLLLLAVVGGQRPAKEETRVSSRRERVIERETAREEDRRTTRSWDDGARVAASGTPGRSAGAEHSLTRGDLPIRAEPATVASETAVPAAAATPPARFLVGRMKDTVSLNEVVPLEVYVSRAASGAKSIQLRPFDVPPEGAEIQLVLFSPGFGPVPGASAVVFQTLKVPAQGDSEPMLFLIQAQQLGNYMIEVSAYRGGAFLGTLKLPVAVERVAEGGRAIERRGEMQDRMAFDAGEVTLQIRYDSASRVYRFQFIAGPWSEDEMRSKPVDAPPAELITGLVTRLSEAARGYTNYNAAEMRDWLRGEGIDLWQQLIPNDLQKVFWQRQSSITRLNVLTSMDADSSGAPIPWEMLYPYNGPNKDAGFLAEQFCVSRWRFGSAPISRLRCTRAALVLPAGSPERAAAEIDSLRQVLSAHGADPGNPIAALTPLTDRLKRGDFDLLHFACHNRFSPQSATVASVTMDDRQFQPTFVRGRDLASRPLVFMNACNTGNSAPAYTRLAGWAGSFVDANAGAFVGSMWEVRDVAAPAFARAFYDALLAPSADDPAVGATLAEALQAARERTQAIDGDPTWLAYTLYGDPAARVVLGGGQ